MRRQTKGKALLDNVLDVLAEAQAAALATLESNGLTPRQQRSKATRQYRDDRWAMITGACETPDAITPTELAGGFLLSHSKAKG
jgi:hypothetical protein